jgi:hypothetical protein
MSTAKLKPIPESMDSLAPHLICEGASEAIEFYKRSVTEWGAFGSVATHLRDMTAQETQTALAKTAH